MANQDQVSLLDQGVEIWNNWRDDNLDVKPDLSDSDLSSCDLAGANLKFANLEGVSFYRSDLTGANFSSAKLLSAYFERATLNDTCFDKADLLYANLSKAYIENSSFISASLRRVEAYESSFRNSNFDQASLRKAEITSSDLEGSSFKGADLSGVSFYGSYLIDSNLSDALLARTEFQYAYLLGTVLTGACIEAWNISTETTIDHLECDYIFLQEEWIPTVPGLVNSGKSVFKERRPRNGNYIPGEFSSLIRASLDTVDLVFIDGIDWQAFFQSFQQLRSHFTDHEIGIQAIEKKGSDFVIRLEGSPEADKSAIETKAKELYGEQLKLLEEQYIEKMKLQGATLEIVQESLIFERQRNTHLLSMVENMANKDKFTQNFNAQVGNVAGVNEGIQQTAQHNYAPEIKQTPAESAKEMQDLLSQLQKSNPTDIKTVVKQRIKTDPTFRQRLQNALKEGGVETLKVLFAPIGIPIEMVRGWVEAGVN